jgi:hypothetical protein
MRVSRTNVFAALAASAGASPIVDARTVTQLDQAAFEEAQQRDDTATRAFSNVQIKVCPPKTSSWLYS